MRKIGHKIDEQGFLLEDVIQGSDIEPDVTTLCPDGFYKPKWDRQKDKWVEGLVYWVLEVTPTEIENEYLITATINNGSSTLENADFKIAETTFTKPIINGKATLTVNLHKVVAKVEVEVSSPNIAKTSINIGKGDKASNIKASLDSTTGKANVKCISKAELTEYYNANTVPEPDIKADLANMHDLALDIMVKLLKWAQNPSQPIQLSNDEQRSLQEIEQTYLPKGRLQLGEIHPVKTDGTLDKPRQDWRWTHIVDHKGQANMSADEYLSLILDPDVK